MLIWKVLCIIAQQSASVSQVIAFKRKKEMEFTHETSIKKSIIKVTAADHLSPIQPFVFARANRAPMFT